MNRAECREHLRLVGVCHDLAEHLVDTSVQLERAVQAAVALEQENARLTETVCGLTCWHLPYPMHRPRCPRSEPDVAS